MNTQKIQTSELETVLQNVHPNRRKVLAAIVLAASAVAAPASASASTIAPAAAHMTANNLASFESAQLLTWIVNEISVLTSPNFRIFTKHSQG